MKVFLFRADGRVFGVTLKESSEDLPTGVGAWNLFKTADMVRGESMPGINVDECLDDIEKYGFHITDAHVRVTEKFV